MNLIEHLFDAPIVALFAYGSALFTKTSTSSPVADFIFIVEDTQLFHSVTKRQYPSHYSFPCSLLTPKVLSFINDEVPSSFFFHPYVREIIPNKMIKYGVISLQSAITDLIDWKYFYLAGRLQKPVYWVKPPSFKYPLLVSAIQKNLISALAISMLLQPEGSDSTSITFWDLFKKIASLSYLGDPRMLIAEDPKKVSKIISMPSVFPYHGEHFSYTKSAMEELYIPLLEELVDVSISYNKNTIINPESSSIEDKLKTSSITYPTTLEYKKYLYSILPNQVQEMVPFTSKFNSEFSSFLCKKVFFSTSLQSTKGLLTAGIVKSSMYLFHKISKRFS